MKKNVFTMVAAAAVAAALLAGCASGSGSSASDPFAGSTWRQDVTYYDGTSLTYEIVFGDNRTYDLSVYSAGYLAEKTTYKYVWNEKKSQLAAQILYQWFPEDAGDLLAASTPEALGSLVRTPHTKAQVEALYTDLAETTADYYAAIGNPLTDYQKQHTVEVYKKIASYNFDSKITYDVSYDDDELSLASSFSKLTDNKMEFYTPSATSNDAVTSIYFVTGSLFQITFDGVDYVATMTNGSAPVVNTSKRTITAYLSYTDQRDGTVYEFGDLVASYTTSGSGNDTVLTLTVQEAPAGLKEMEGTVATLVFIPDGWTLRRVD